MKQFTIGAHEETECTGCGAELRQGDYAVVNHAGEVYCSHFCAPRKPAREIPKMSKAA
jgi:hypothetical protein